MMNKSVIHKGILDGLMGSIILDVVLSITVSMCAYDTLPLLICLLGVAISSAVYFILIQHNSSNRELICYSLSSIISFITFYVVILAIHILIPVNSAFVRQGNNADSIILLLAMGLFLVTSFLLKLFIFIILVIRNKTWDGLREPF